MKKEATRFEIRSGRQVAAVAVAVAEEEQEAAVGEAIEGRASEERLCTPQEIPTVELPPVTEYDQPRYS